MTDPLIDFLESLEYMPEDRRKRVVALVLRRFKQATAELDADRARMELMLRLGVRTRPPLH